MIVYQATKQDFSTHVLSGEIEQVILRRFQEKLMELIEPKFFRKGLLVDGYGIKLLP
jgi:hypothetical protein